VSGGMLFIEAKYEDKTLKLDREVQILMPKTYKPSQNLPTSEEEIAATAMRVFTADSLTAKNKTIIDKSNLMSSLCAYLKNCCIFDASES
jgi:hypothetical protein